VIEVAAPIDETNDHARAGQEEAGGPTSVSPSYCGIPRAEGWSVLIRGPRTR
jgi:hypothetical protein